MKQPADRLYHVSDVPNVQSFEPRPADSQNGRSLVWAIDRDHLPNYLLPRDCPRVTYCAREDSNKADVDRLMCGVSAKKVIAVESIWFRRIAEEKLYVYEFEPGSFELLDETAGYYVCEKAIEPAAQREVTDIFVELLKHDVELRILPSLWKLREEVINSGLEFSIIRMRNAQPPAEGYGAYHPLPQK